MCFNKRVQCLHCQNHFFPQWADRPFAANDVQGQWVVNYVICPACERFTIRLERRAGGKIQETIDAYPKMVRRPAPEQVPNDIAQDYREACTVLPDSAKASAALSRRLLQRLLREQAGVKPADLSTEIQSVLDSAVLPKTLAEDLDAVRAIGNFAAHPIKLKNTGEVVDVEPGEAEWTLDVLDDLFDFYFVQPDKSRIRREALNKKLKDSGKPPLKAPNE
jgi:hypothetical protein